MITRAVIAAAGRGTRMGELTKDKPKHLILVNGKPFLYYVIKNIQEAGYKNVIIVAGYFADMIRKFTAEYFPDARVVDQFAILGEEKYGTAATVECAKDAIGQHPFVMIYGDNLYSPRDLKSMQIDDAYNYVAGLKHDHPEKYGVLVTKGDMLERIVEKPQEFVSDIINVGLYKFMPEIFDACDKVVPSPRGEYELTDAISMLAKEGKVKVVKLQDYWKDFGRPEDITKMEEFLKS